MSGTQQAHPAHGNKNQQWEISPMGAGYSIRSVHNGNYVTIESGLADGTVVANPYPVSWVFDASDPEENVWKIGWPNNALCLNMEVVTFCCKVTTHPQEALASLAPRKTGSHWQRRPGPI